MSRLDELIKVYCPNGVEYKRMGDVCKLVTGATPRKTKIEYWEGGTIPWMSSGEVNLKRVNDTERKITQLGYEKTSTTLVPIHSIVIALAGQGKTRGKVAITEIELCTNQSLCSIIVNDKLNYKFLYYFLDGKYEDLRTISNGEGTRGGLSLKILSPYKVPVPPLPVQEEIVRILDKFTDYVTELQAELQARKQQYEYYKHSLICSKKNEVALSDVAEYVKSRINASEVDENTYVGVDNLLQNCAGKTSSNHVPKEGNLINYNKDDILIGNIRPYLKKIWFANNDGGTNGDVLTIRVSDKAKLIPQYLYYILSSEDFFTYNTNNSKGAKMPRGDKEAVMKYKLSLPSVERQCELVNTLNRFEFLCNDITSGLPAEIEARQKQYEYYRDKLLSFKELEA